MLTLVTCYPFHWIGPAPKRFIVRAHQVHPAEPLAGGAAAAKAQGPSGPGPLVDKANLARHIPN
jgi:hypothetical protein